jgi:predicted DNA-binding protein with PD1-like motif
MPGVAGAAEVYRVFDEPMEIISLTGTLSPDGPHIHISLSRGDGACVGGHVGAGCLVHTTAELVIGELTDAEFRRMSDPATGHAELGVLPRPAEGHTSET